MNVFFGPILRRAGGYEFDTCSAGRSVEPSFPYRKLEDARYARRVAIASANREIGLSAIGCDTAAEFIENCSSLVDPSMTASAPLH
jgi:hypothetical protein